MKIERAAVIGSGVMGGAIAAHIANAGVPVLLLDIVPEGANDRDMVAKAAIERMLKTDPAPFMTKKAARNVTPGNIEDHLEKLAECDWIVEAVIENKDIKSDLYKKVDAARKPGSVVSSNTSTIPLGDLVDGQSDAFTSDFMITHFFNPPRYMRLLEVVTGEATRPQAVEAIRAFGDRVLGKAVVDCNDRPGFIANRIGTFWIQASINATMDLDMKIEEADAIVSRPMGIPKTGVFALMDLIGLDLMPYVAKSLLSNLPPEDGYARIFREFPVMEKMIADGYTGRKGKGGFFRMERSGGKKELQAIDLKTGEYRPKEEARLESVKAGKEGLRALVEHPDKGGQLAWAVLSQTLGYSASLVPEIAGDVVAVDEAMRTGYGWKAGPFEMIDQLGAAWFAERLAGDGKEVPALLETAAAKGGFYKVEDGQLFFLTVDGAYEKVMRPDGVLLLQDVKRASKPVAKNASASLWDIGDGVLCLEFTGKMNALDDQVFDMIEKAIGLCSGGQYKALVIHNEGTNFSVGANLGLAMFALNIALWPQVEQSVRRGQQVYKAMKYAPFPVVGAPSGMALGGGCEILLHCDGVQAHAESYIGLVEVGVGIIPGWGGCKEMVARHMGNKKRAGGPMPPLTEAFQTIGLAKVAKSAHEAKELLFLRDGDGITMNRERVLFDAKAKALAMAETYKPPEPPEFVLPGPTAQTIINATVEGYHREGKATDHDVVVSAALANVISGGDADVTDILSEDDMLELEARNFMKLVRTSATVDRIEHMLSTGKPLRN